VKAAVFNCRPYRAPLPLGRGRRTGAENRTKRPATRRCGLRLPSPLTGAASNRPPRSRPTKAVVSNCRPPRGPSPLGRGHRPWVEAAQNARQLEVAGFICQAPCGGCVPPPPAVSPPRRPQFSTAGRVEPNAPGRGYPPWEGAAQNARQLDVAGFICQAPCGGCVPPPPAVSPPRRPQFSTAGRGGPPRENLRLSLLYRFGVE